MRNNTDSYTFINNSSVSAILIAVLALAISVAGQRTGSEEVTGVYDYGAVGTVVVVTTEGSTTRIEWVDYIPEDRVLIKRDILNIEGELRNGVLIGSADEKRFDEIISRPYRVDFSRRGDSVIVEAAKLTCANGRCRIASGWEKVQEIRLRSSEILPVRQKQAGDPPGYSERVRDAQRRINESLSLPYEERLKVADEIVDVLIPFAEVDQRFSRAIGAVRSSISRKISMSLVRQEIRSSSSNGVDLDRLAERTMRNAESIVHASDPDGMTVDDARRLLGIAKDIADIEHARTGGSRPERVSKALGYVRASLAIASGLSEGDKKKITDGAADILEEVGGSLPFMREAGGAFSSLQDENRENLEAVADVIEDLRDAIVNGDQESLDRLVENANSIQETISGESYGNAILSGSGTLSLFPFLRDVDRLFSNEDVNTASGVKSSNEVGNKVLALQTQVHSEIWNRSNGKVGRDTWYEIQPVIYISRNQLRVYAEAHNNYAYPTFHPWDFSWCAEHSRVGLTSVTVTYADGEEVVFRPDDGSFSGGDTFETGPRIMNKIVTEQQCVGRRWKHTWEVSGY